MTKYPRHRYKPKPPTLKTIKCLHCLKKIDVTEPIRAHFARLGRLGGHLRHGTPLDEAPMDYISQITCPYCMKEIHIKEILKGYFTKMGVIGGTVSRRELSSRKAREMGRISGRVRAEKAKKRKEDEGNSPENKDFEVEVICKKK